ncbi:unnamed protein product [Arabidopsis lyrata]|nr:unnamed protein product [Arabidopsis lyrata]
MNQAAVVTANSSRKFYTLETVLTPVQTLYGLLQCTPDLTRQDCLSCLQSSINSIHLYAVGGRFVYPSCNARYELYSFYNGTAIGTPLGPLPSPPPLPSPAPAPAPAPSLHGKGGNSNVLVVAIVVPITVVALLLIAGYCFLAKRAKKTSDTEPTFDGNDITTVESLQLDYKMIRAATNKFSENNKIGQGGFGEVYKGTFLNGTEVAVKRLSKSSGQGHTEFKNEVVVVAKLQHKSLVRLLGFSLEGEERILVYEYVPNKSLDYFIFDPAKQGQLDWTERHKIIEGIARGILYLHQDSRLTIIHRDLKASNILLDADMNPKIADFGMARIFEMDQSQENTSRIVGTFGYMSPEYAINGQFSVKSDVYSFGVLVLEIISGKKNKSFYETDGAHNLVSYAWSLWSKGTALDLVDLIIIDNCQKSEVARCIHICLLCVQEDPEERPIMSTIFMMLTNDTTPLIAAFATLFGAELCVKIGFTVVFAPECGKTGVFVPNGRYDKNRGLLLSSLASNVSAQSGYFNTSIGQGPDRRVYALGMCIQGAEPEQFDFKTIEAATNKFSESNIIGRGGFGEVFKAVLNGTEVAIKRLSKSSNKVHMREEKILVYEFVPNKSLDYFLFDPMKQGELDWTKRYNIILGITRGILYLHQDSRLTIIHRDLKASNILLDANMNPKIADFGMARIFGIDQSGANTNRIAGTRGYMPPEYVMHGQFSTKSDVYSFGVLVLEIICGQNNRFVHQSDTTAENLVTYAWRLWRNGSPLELVDPTISENCETEEVISCIHIALLCVQHSPTDRPSLSTINMMLTNNSYVLPDPQQPGFFFPNKSNKERDGLESSQSTNRSSSQTINDVTITDLEPR